MRLAILIGAAVDVPACRTEQPALRAEGAAVQRDCPVDTRSMTTADIVVTECLPLAFTERHRGGSDHVFTRDGVVEILNLQPRVGGEAYQVKQVRDLIPRCQLAEPFLSDTERDDEA